MVAESIKKTDLEPILTRHPGNRTFSGALESIVDGKELLRVLGRYIFINAPFAGGVANLAGEIAVRQNLFRDSEEGIAGLADRSAQVAADIFYACIDEFQDRSTPRRDTHRSLAQATLKGIGRYYDYADATINDLLQPTAALLKDVQNVRDGYGLSQPTDEEELLRAIGFHAGSEILADEEFRILDGFLRSRHPELVMYLQGHKVNLGGATYPAYTWIEIHTTVEADHFRLALQGANDALCYYAGTRPATEVKGLILQGFAEFAAVQAEFMAHLS